MDLVTLKYKVNIYRRFFYWRAQCCIYIHVPKAAGTSISQSIYGRPLGHYSALKIRKTFPRLFERTFVFSFVRNPWDRVLSAYLFARKGRTETMGVRNPDQYRIPAFASFERFVLEWLPTQDIASLDFIFQPQHHFVCDGSDQLLTAYLGRVEDMQSGLTEVSARLGRTIEVGRVNSTRVAGKGYRYAYLSDRMVEAVAEVYSKDIDLFGYTFEANGG